MFGQFNIFKSEPVVAKEPLSIPEKPKKLPPVYSASFKYKLIIHLKDGGIEYELLSKKIYQSSTDIHLAEYSDNVKSYLIRELANDYQSTSLFEKSYAITRENGTSLVVPGDFIKCVEIGNEFIDYKVERRYT